MGRPSRIPDLFDECHKIEMKDLIQWGYLKPGQTKSGTITWSRNCNKTGCIDIWVSTHSENYNLTLSYHYGGKHVLYKVEMTSVPSNLGRGQVWYFLCPETGKRCRKLYRLGPKFLHREAYTGALYDTQTYSQKNRALFKIYNKDFISDEVFEELYSKHFKTHYAGKPTKRLEKLRKKIEEAEGSPVTYEELLKM